MKKTKKIEGITLVALMLIIVILLILATVTISNIENTDIPKHANNLMVDLEELDSEEQEKFEQIKGNLIQQLGK